jgi:hypothetical protein
VNNELYRGRITRHGEWPRVSVVLTQEINAVVGWLETDADEDNSATQWRMHFELWNRDEAIEWAVDYVNQERLAALERAEAET